MHALSSPTRHYTRRRILPLLRCSYLRSLCSTANADLTCGPTATAEPSKEARALNVIFDMLMRPRQNIKNRKSAARRSNRRRQINLALNHCLSDFETRDDRETDTELDIGAGIVELAGGEERCFLGHTLHVNL